MSMLEYDSFTKLEDVRWGTSEGGLYLGPDDGKWHLKYPESERQAHNEILASRFYDEMGFDAVQYHLVDNGMVASRWRGGLPHTSEASDLRESAAALESFMPSALIENWDVIGLEYDNCLYDPDSMTEPVFLDFGGSFDTRAMGGYKPFDGDTIRAFEGFTDSGINHAAYSVFRAMSPARFQASRKRVAGLSDQAIGRIVKEATEAEVEGEEGRIGALQRRRDSIRQTEYDEVF